MKIIIIIRSTNWVVFIIKMIILSKQIMIISIKKHHHNFVVKLSQHWNKKNCLKMPVI